MRKNEFKQLWIGSLKRSPIGTIWAAVSQNGLAVVEIGGDEFTFVKTLTSLYSVPVKRDQDKMTSALKQIEAYLKGRQQDFDIPLDWSGMSDFQRKALKAVCDIPYGETRSYGEIAAQIGRPGASRAVGRANATNPIPLVIPCHRVIGADGELRGYGGGEGLATKAWLLSLERGVVRIVVF